MRLRWEEVLWNGVITAGPRLFSLKTLSFFLSLKAAPEGSFFGFYTKWDFVSMNIKLEDIDFEAFDDLDDLIRNSYKSKFLENSIKKYTISISNYSANNNELSSEQIKEIQLRKDELKVKFIEGNSSAIFYILGSWVDAYWGIAKINSEVELDTSFINRKIHVWDNVHNENWYYFLFE